MRTCLIVGVVTCGVWPLRAAVLQQAESGHACGFMWKGSQSREASWRKDLLSTERAVVRLFRISDITSSNRVELFDESNPR